MIYLIVIMFCCLLFFVITYPYERKLKRKLDRVLSYEEVTHLVKDTDFKMYGIDENEDNLNIEEKFLNCDYVNEKVKYIMVSPKNKDLSDIPCLILLHGIRDFPEDWINRAHLIDNYLTLKEKKEIGDMIFILPESGYNGESWYTNFYKDLNHKYEDLIVNELYKEIKKISPKGKVGIAGFSMGGYGAYKIGLKNIEKFDVIGSFSGAVSLIRMSVNRRVMRVMKYIYIPKCLFNDLDKTNFIRIFSSWGWRILKEDPYSILKDIDKNKLIDKKFYLSVGAEDKKPYLMMQQWIDIVGRLKKYEIDFTAYMYGNEIHTWDFISKDLVNFLKYFNKYSKTK